VIIPKYEGDAGNGGAFLGLVLCIATRHHHLCKRVLSQSTTDRLAGLTVSLSCHRAGVDYIKIGVLGRTHELPLISREILRHGRRFNTIDLAAKRRDRCKPGGLGQT